MGAVLPPWPYPAAATETSARICGKETVTVVKKQNGQGRSVRIHGNLILSHGTRRITGARSSSVDVSRQAEVVLDHRADDVSLAAFSCIESCGNFIHDMLARAPATREYDLAAAGSWMGSARKPLHVVTALLMQLLDVDDWMDSGLELDVHLPELRVALAYSEPKALLLACKDAAAAKEMPGGRKRRREPAADGEVCPICLLGVEAAREDAVSLPCSHPFHDKCILTWFHRSSTCPSCRLDIMECFSSLRSAAPDPVINYDLTRIRIRNLFGDESEEEPADIAQGEQSIIYEM